MTALDLIYLYHIQYFVAISFYWRREPECQERQTEFHQKTDNPRQLYIYYIC